MESVFTSFMEHASKRDALLEKMRTQPCSNAELAALLADPSENLFVKAWAAHLFRQQDPDGYHSAATRQIRSFTEPVVVPADLGLGEKEVLTLFFGMQSAEWNDEKMLMAAIQGMVNRGGPMIYYDPKNWPGTWSGDPDCWYNHYGKDYGYTFRRTDGKTSEAILEDLLQRTLALFNGIVLYDTDNWEYYNCFLAYNVANHTFSLPVSKRLYNGHPNWFKNAQIVEAFDVESPMDETATYRWLMDYILPLCDRTGIQPLAWDGDFANRDRVPAVDYAYYRRFFIHGLSSGDQYREIMTSLEKPAVDWGWNTSGESVCSNFGHYQNATIQGSCNLSFHTGVKPLKKPPYRQSFLPKIDTPEKKLYLAVVANEGDITGVLTTQYKGAWNSFARGRVPLNWAINADYARYFPAMVEYFFQTKTDNDYFTGGPSGAGYIHPEKMTPEDLDVFAKHTNRAFTEGIELRDAVLWVADKPEIWETFARNIPSLQLLDINPHPRRIPYGDMKFTQSGVPVLFESSRIHYWYPLYQNQDRVAVMESKIMEIYENVPKPYYSVMYSCEITAPDDVLQLSQRLDPNKVEFIDLNTMAHLIQAGSPNDCRK